MREMIIIITSEGKHKRVNLLVVHETCRHKKMCYLQDLQKKVATHIHSSARHFKCMQFPFGNMLCYK